MSGELACRSCAGTLHLLPDSYPLLQFCDLGHFSPFNELLDGIIPGQTIQMDATVREWELRAVSLARLAGRALENGHIFLAADFQDASRRIMERIAGVQPVGKD